MTRAFKTRILLAVCGAAIAAAPAAAQRGRAGAGGPPPTAQAAAGTDLTGYWVSLVTEDWRWRMMTPAPGDFPSVPLNPEGRRVAGLWDPAKETPEDKCKVYGAGAIMRVPTRLHITWQDENTLKVETDAGTQTRLFSFAGGRGGAVTTAAASAPTLQGRSVAEWEYAGGRAFRGGGPAPTAQLKVVTTNLAPGFLQRNGVPYSGNAVVTEYFNRLNQPSGDPYMVVTTIVEDPQYLNTRYARSSHFKKEPDGSKWKPTPCE